MMRPWPDRLREWMATIPITDIGLASALSINKRTVFRWLAGTSLPNDDALAGLKHVGAPLPGKATARKPPASERIEGELKEIKAQLGQVLELLTRRG